VSETYLILIYLSILYLLESRLRRQHYTLHNFLTVWGRRGTDHMVVGFIITCAFSAYPH